MDAVTDLPPYTVLENGYIHGTWFCGRPMRKYYGAFPQSFWPRAKRVLKPWGSMLHWFSGTMPPEEGITSMEKIERMIAEVHEWREFHAAQYRQGVKGAGIEAAACAIREQALLDARAAIQAERSNG